MSRYRTAILGCGRMGSTLADECRFAGVHSHAQAYSHSPRTELVAVCDAAEPAERCAARWGVPRAVTSVEALLARGPFDIVSICTPDATHFPLALRLLNENACRALFVEKPLSLDLAEGERLVALARERKVLLAVNYSRRFAAGFARLKRDLDDGLLGRVHTVHGYYTKGVTHNGTHWFDLARWLVGEMRVVAAWDRLHEGGADPTLDVRLEFASGAAGFLHGLSCRDYTLWEMDLLGTAGRVRVVQSGQRLEVFRTVEGKAVRGYTFLEHVEERASEQEFALASAVEQIVAWLDHGQAVGCVGEDARAALAVAVEALELARRVPALELRL